MAAWALGLLAGPAAAQTPPSSDVTFSRDIVPILQRSCENCHRPDGAGPMSLITYQEVRRYGARIRERTAIRDRMGTMPPWYVEKDIGIQHYKNDPSPYDEDLELNWQLAPQEWGHGYAAEAGKALVRWAFTQDVDELFAVARPRNTRAVGMAQRLGMEWVGETSKYYGLQLQVYRIRPSDLQQWPG